jgi:menaquinone-dependent protoporphyrinogen oxidase
MTRVLIVYGTSYGQTERVVRRLAARLESHDFVVTLRRGNDRAPEPQPGEYEAIAIAASVIRGKHQRYISDFVASHVDQLNCMPSAFISVSGAAGTPEGEAEARGYVEEFCRATGWRPSLTAAFGGAIAYTRYGFLLRYIMRRITSRRGGPTDTSRDHELTDWDAVARFADECEATFGAGAPVMASAPASGAARHGGSSRPR